MGDEFTDREIIKLLDKLIGPTVATGNSDADERVMRNLRTLIYIGNWCLDGLAYAAETRHRPEQSMRDIGETAFSAMDEWRQWLEERIKEM